MVTGRVRELQELDPRKVKIEYEKPRWHDAWKDNPRIVHPGEKCDDFQTYHPRTNYLRPYMTAKTADRWTWKEYGPPRGELYLRDVELKMGEMFPDRIILEPLLKPGASPNKQWPFGHWKELARLLELDGEVAQLAPAEPRRLPEAEFIWTRSMRLAASVMKTARLAILPEGGLHHVAAAMGTKAIVIFGGYISPKVTGYKEHVNLFVESNEHPLGCGWRVPCTHCVNAMRSITPEEVYAKAKELLK